MSKLAYDDLDLQTGRWPDEDQLERYGRDSHATRHPAAPPIAIQWHGDADPNADRAWLVAYTLFEVGRGLLSGQWGTGKTFTALDLAASVMTGEPFAGKRVMRTGGVLFIAPEGASEIPIRLRGLVESKLKGFALTQALAGRDIDLERLPLAWIEECPPLVTPASFDRLIATARAAADRMREEFDVPLVLIIVDTVSAAAGFADENSAAEGQKVMNALGTLATETGSFVLGVDHFGKAVETGTRGTSSKEAAADTVLALLADKSIEGTISNTRMAVRKVRGARCGYEIPYRLDVVTLGENKFGDPITTCIVEWQASRDATATVPGGKDKWTTTLRVFRHALEAALEEHGIRSWPHGAKESEQRAVAVDKVRAAFYATYPADGDDDGKRAEAKKKAFQRAVSQAIGKGLIGSIELQGVDHLWLKPE